MTQKLELANVSFSVRPVNIPHPDDKGKIPDKLAEATFTLLHIHKANGDLAWVGDMAHEMELGYQPGNDVPQPESTERIAVKLFRDYFESMADQYGTDEAWKAVNKLADMCRDPEYIAP
jgi:hypothetical protein